MKVIIATKNEGKIEGARRAFSHYFENLEIIGIPAPSDVSEQPLNDEILLGAKIE
jgi:non-canonical (house-cleaning) NTP pyrophosphatase